VLTSTLFKHHLIDRVRLESDRRVIQLSLTEEGKKVVNEVIKQRAEAFIELFRDMKNEEIDQVTNVFKKLDNLLT
jgi:MarR family 2-MHQ and catechol resistance regulon transcriptional repressor